MMRYAMIVAVGLVLALAGSVHAQWYGPNYSAEAYVIRPYIYAFGYPFLRPGTYRHYIPWTRCDCDRDAGDARDRRYTGWYWSKDHQAKRADRGHSTYRSANPYPLYWHPR